MAEWDFTTDFVSIGSGGGGLASALAVNSKGYDALVLEKREVIGGSTAMSGGVLWIPNNPLMVSEGVDDSHEDAMAYFEDVVGDVGPASSYERREAYITRGPEMVSFLQRPGALVSPLRGLFGLLPRCEGWKGAGTIDRGDGLRRPPPRPMVREAPARLPLRNVGSGRLHRRTRPS